MPELSTRVRTRLRLPPAILIAISLAASGTLGGCAGGDFGRTRGDFRNDDMHRWLGIEATGSCARRNTSSPTRNACCAISLIR
jgi:hypothetical protein